MFGNKGPFAHRNVRLFVWFKLLFNARFYYPVLAILFLDLGLTLDQFVILNAIWAATIFLAEVPSGALADIIGRKKLLVIATACMVAEMVTLLFAPLEGGWLLFSVCALNRVLSGLSEAAASGADEALAYDTLEEAEEEDLWDDALATSMRWSAGAMIIAVITGAAVYDPRFLNGFLASLGWQTSFTQAETLRLPIFLCLIQALAAFLISLRFRDIDECEEKTRAWKDVWRQTLDAARWVFSTRTALFIVFGALTIDAFARNFATINSSYFRLIELPESLYGVIAAGTALIGLALPSIARRLARALSLKANYVIAAVWTLLSLILLIPTWKWWGVIPAILLMAALSFISFLVSRSLNKIASSSQRATVLSVKGLLFNLGYGAISLLFSLGVAYGRKSIDLEGDALEDHAFIFALTWQPLVLIVLFGFILLSFRRTNIPAG